ncbi:type I-F CRISPR-associated protein Csy1 [Shewanella sp. WXL01]|uniref:type I-F CRISPR-associated protein Csy1 n=1 Tax=Shewanella sp. WXL01 TaxID=2709721 RepID=UPI0014386229|nr:type I-F CRISPR-associated protein Csy1 [Shewanella sp. WXL01]NKF51194.1 type I-F CRISPR-associated protein Csy1 [Shewanella sp. WXL01]
MLDPAIKNFFDERKAAWLKKNIKASMDDQQQKALSIECDELFALNLWLPNAAKRAGQISIATHPCTFSHPSARKNKNGYVTSVIAQAPQANDGFLRSGNLAVEADALGNAAALDVYKFLMLKMDDGNSLLSHIEQQTELANDLLMQGDTDAKELRAGFLAMVASSSDIVSSSKIKQVYFPVAEGEYHLLSVLTHSGHLFEQRKRLDKLRFSDEVKAARQARKNNELHDNGYSEIYGLTTIGYGGTKPQNISVLNNQNAGKAHLLASVPPNLKPRSVRLPKTNFFKDTFTPWLQKEAFAGLHRIFCIERKTFDIRQGLDTRYQAYVDAVILKMWQVRNFLVDYQGQPSEHLKAEHKTWLYPEFEEQRQMQDEWLEVVVRDIARSLSQGYQKVIGDKAFVLADEELFQIEKTVINNKEALR